MVLELAGDRTVLGPVAGVVGPHRELVDQHPPVAGLEQLDREDPDDVELLGDRERDLLGARGQPRRRGRAPGPRPRGRCRRAGCWRRRGTPRPDHSATAPPARPARDGSRRAPRRAPGRRSRAAVANASSASVGSRTIQTPRPSYPPRVTLSTHGSPNASTSAAVVTTACRGHGSPSAREPRPHHGLVLGVDQRLRARPYGDARLGQRVQVLGGHVLVVEGDDLGPAGDLPQHLEVSVVTDDRVGDDLRRRHPLRLGQQPQRDPERRGRLGQHPRELPATDHGDSGREVGHGTTLAGRLHFCRWPRWVRRPDSRVSDPRRGCQAGPRCGPSGLTAPARPRRAGYRVAAGAGCGPAVVEEVAQRPSRNPPQPALGATFGPRPLVGSGVGCPQR